MTLGWIIGAIVGVIALISYVQHRAARDTYRTLASRQPARPTRQEVPLGMEGTDIDAVTRVTRRNEALERGHTNWTPGKSGLFGGADLSVEPLADDETYARRFHTAFHKDTDKTKD